MTLFVYFINKSEPDIFDLKSDQPFLQAHFLLRFYDLRRVRCAVLTNETKDSLVYSDIYIYKNPLFFEVLQ